MLVYLSSIEHVVRIEVCPPSMEAIVHVEGMLIWSKIEFSKIGMVFMVFHNVSNIVIHSYNADFTFSSEEGF